MFHRDDLRQGPRGAPGPAGRVAGPGAAPGLLVVPLPQEQEQLYRRAGVVSSATFEQPSRQVKLWVKMVTPLIKNFF